MTVGEGDNKKGGSRERKKSGFLPLGGNSGLDGLVIFPAISLFRIDIDNYLNLKIYRKLPSKSLLPVAYASVQIV